MAIADFCTFPASPSCLRRAKNEPSGIPYSSLASLLHSVTPDADNLSASRVHFFRVERLDKMEPARFLKKRIAFDRLDALMSLATDAHITNPRPPEILI